MSDHPLSQRDTAILLLLMAEARELTNKELRERFGLEIKKGERERLHRLKLIDVGKQGPSFTHTLTDDGWARTTEIFRAGIPMSRALAPRALEAAVRAMVSGLQRHLARTGDALADVFGREEDAAPDASGAQAARPAPPAGGADDSTGDIETRIRKAYARLAERPNAWVSLTRLRPLLGDAARDDVDATLRRMIALPDVRLVPWESQKTLTQADRDAAVIIGDQPKHRILIGA